MTEKKINVVQDPEKPVERNILATAIIEVSRAMKNLRCTGLTRDAIVVLVKDRTGLGKGTIETVIDCLAQLEREFVR